MTTRVLQFLAGGALLLAGGRAAAGAEPAAAPAQLRRELFHVGVSEIAFKNLNRNDAEAAFKVFAGIIGRQRGYALEVTVRTFDDPAALATAVRAGELHLYMPDAWNLPAMDFAERGAPAFVPAWSEGPTRRFVLVTRRDRRPSELAGLAGRTLLIHDSPNAGIGAHWLEVVLHERGHGGTSRFFREVQRHAKPAAAVLPVFFGRADVCLVDTISLALMAELNPQVGRELVPVLESEPLINSLVALSVDGWHTPAFRQAVELALADLNKDPAGRQILLLFQCDRLVPYDLAQLENVRRLRARAQAVGLLTSAPTGPEPARAAASSPISAP